MKKDNHKNQWTWTTKKPNILAFLKEVVTANKRSYAYFIRYLRKILAFIQESEFYYYFLLCNSVTLDEHFGLFAR